MNQKYRVGIVGLGNIASGYGSPKEAAPYCHVGGIMQSERVELAAVADLSAASVAAFQEKWGAHFPTTRAYGSVGDMLANEELDIVGVCVRGPYHAEVMREILASKRGMRAIFLEKPPSFSLEEMDAWEAEAACKGVPVTVSYSRHWYPSTLKMEQLVREGIIGDVCAVVGYTSNGFLSFASHTTDLICQFAQCQTGSGYHPVAVRASGRLSGEAPEGFIAEPAPLHLAVEFENGVAALQVAGPGDHGAFYVDVFGTKGRARVQIDMMPMLWDADGKQIFMAHVMPPTTSIFRRAYDQIAEHLDGGPLPDCTGANAGAVNEIGFAAIESALDGSKQVTLPNARRDRKVWADN